MDWFNFYHSQEPTVFHVRQCLAMLKSRSFEYVCEIIWAKTATRIDMLLFIKPSCNYSTNYILLFLLSDASFLDSGLVPSIGKLVASSLIEGESGATVLLVNAGKVKEKRKINLDKYNPCT